MTLHGLKTDLELLVMLLTAGIASYLVTGQVLSNVLFTFLLASLFFLIGLHLDLGFFGALRNRRKPISLALVSVFGLVPAIAYIFSFVPGQIGDAFLVLGASGAALSSPRIWANISNSDGNLVRYGSTFSFFGCMIFTPILLYLFPIDIDYSLMAQNLPLVAIPFAVGLVTRNYENRIIEDLRIHFSKLSFWLITVITLVQTKLILQADGLVYGSRLLIAALLFSAFGVLTFGYSHILGVLSGLYEKEARALGFISSSRNIAVAFFISVHVSAEAVMLVGVYYFVRQLTGFLFVDMYLHGEPKFLERIGF